MDADTYRRLEHLAAVDRRSVANILDILIARGLTGLEGEILKEEAGGEPLHQPAPKSKSRKKQPDLP